MDHLVLHCPITKLDGGYDTILRANDDPQLTEWIERFSVEV